MSADARASMPVISIEGRTLAYREAGDPTHPPVLLVHSGGFSSRQWRKLIDVLSPEYHTLAPDLLGYGGSSRWSDREPFDASTDVAALLALLDRFAGVPVHLIGHSYGGYLALQLALARPAAIRSIAVYEPVAFAVLSESERTALPDVALEGDQVDDRWLAQFVEWWNGPGAWAALQPETQQGFRDVAWKLYQEVLSLGRDTTSVERYATITAKTLILGGDRSPAIEASVVGHMGPLTHAPLIHRAITAHLADAR
jgi:pimeloyl-ACP methyl ester carboxylesterase